MFWLPHSVCVRVRTSLIVCAFAPLLLCVWTCLTVCVCVCVDVSYWLCVPVSLCVLVWTSLTVSGHLSAVRNCRQWQGVCCSVDGTRAAAVEWSGSIWISRDSGNKQCTVCSWCAVDGVLLMVYCQYCAADDLLLPACSAARYFQCGANDLLLTVCCC